ncbi:MAG: 4Fe-4S dicluster domain-containing protein [Nevskiales bacterium]|nr:4Fe-4S dicluster domain-containing protein [Nevskiales bacterium]
MNPPADADVSPAVLTVDGFQCLIDELQRRGYRVIGPTVADGAIVYDDLASVDALPRGVGDAQDAGRYRLTRRDDEALFGYAVGPHSWKRFLNPPRLKLWSSRREGDGVRVEPAPEPRQPLAFIGVRGCELRAIAIQDRVFLGGRYVDRPYDVRRRGAFIVAVSCGTAGGTCFCTSMGSGPRAQGDFDLALTEIVDAGEHHFVVEVGSDAGREIMAQLPSRDATSADCRQAERIVAATAASMGRSLPAEGVRELLLDNLDHPRWDQVAERCLSCANCTMVCPTCFCSSVEDSSDLASEETARERRWDSCFTTDFAYLHGGSVRATTRARYRQWMTHKLATWIDQFGSSGCVGCGRCITWCPVGIDITEEVRAIAAAPARTGGSDHADGHAQD